MSSVIKSQNDTRRLHRRYRIETSALLRFYHPKSDYATEIAARVIEASVDSLILIVHQAEQIKEGAKTAVNILMSGNSKIVYGQIIRCKGMEDGNVRVCVSLAADSNINPEALSGNAVPIERRQTVRRQSQNGKEINRQYERRGVWKGLEAKRFFSHHAWELKKNDVYFYMKPLESAVNNHVRFGGREMIMMASNNYLGLNTHPKVKEAAIQAIKQYGTGSSGSNLVGGTYDIHLKLEEVLAQLLKVECATICISGYVANTTTLATILNKDDAVFNDALNHASLMEGSLRSGATFRTFRHNDMVDLEKKLARCKSVHKLVAADAVYSMDGDLAPLPELFRLCKKYNAALMLDQAHTTGVFGENGGGLLEHFGMDGKADVVVGTMSKSLAAIGGFIGGSKELIAILKHSARQIFFSTNVPPSACASILAAIEVMRDEPDRRLALWRNAEHLRSGLQVLGFNTGMSQSPIIPVIFPTEKETNLMAKALLEQDIYVTPIIYPAVKKNQTRIRLSVIATHTPQDINNTLAAFKRAKSKI